MPFSSVKRTDASPKRASESNYNFLERSARPEIERVRKFLGEAIGRYPSGERDELLSRIKSDDQFRSTTFEILLHEALLRLGFSLVHHPDPATGTKKRPDFLVTTDKGDSFYLEAVLASTRDGRSPSAESIKHRSLGRLDIVPHHDFVLDVQSDGDPITQPSTNNLIREVHEWLNSLDVEKLRISLETSGYDSMPTLHWSHENWDLVFTAIPLSAFQRGKMIRLIGASGGGGRIINT